MKYNRKVCYAVYDTQDKEQCIGVFNTVVEVAKYFGLEPHSVSSSMCKKCLIKHRYEVKRINMLGGE